MTTSGWTAIPYGTQWRPHVLALMALVQGHEPSEAEFVWWFERNPTKYVNIYLAEREGRIIGVSSTGPSRVWCQGAESLVPFALNVLTHPDFRGQGIFSALELATEADAARQGCPFMLSFPNTLSTPIFVNRLGWSHGRAPGVMVKVLDPGRVARTALGVTIPAAIAVAARAAVRRTFRSRPSPALEPIDEFDRSFDRLWERERARRRWGLVRDATYLNWRFLESPVRRYRCWRIRNGGDLAGYLVTGVTAKKGLRLGVLADVFTALGDRQSLTSALATADAWFAAEEVDAVLAFPPAGALAVLRYLGFAYLPTPKRLNFIYKALEPAFGALPFGEASRWQFTPGDLDFF